jgi:hypothetical protein
MPDVPTLDEEVRVASFRRRFSSTPKSFVRPMAPSVAEEQPPIVSSIDDVCDYVAPRGFTAA